MRESVELAPPGQPEVRGSPGPGRLDDSQSDHTALSPDPYHSGGDCPSMTLVRPTSRPRTEATASPTPGPCTIEIAVPVYNEEAVLRSSIGRLRSYLDHHFPFSALVTIADNASTDNTWAIASDLAATLPGVNAVRLHEKGRGRALQATWRASNAAVVAYMDVDLATDLDALLPLVAPLISGHSDVAIGSRLAPGAHVVRGPKRELISRCYNLIVRATLHNGFTDAQCGFKALRGDVARALLPLVEDQQWFFDTELLVQAERHDLRIHEVPVDWVDDLDSRVDIARTALDDLKGVWRLMRTRPAADDAERWHDAPPRRSPSLRRFAGVGLVSTVVYLALFLVLRQAVDAYLANTLALVACTVANGMVHRRFSLGGQPPMTARHDVLAAAVMLGVSLALTTAALGAVRALAPASVMVEVAALVAATALVALCRFAVLAAWAFRAHRRGIAEIPSADQETEIR